MYRATLNNTEFFNTAYDDDRYTLISANIAFEENTSGAFTFIVPPSNIRYDYFHNNSTNYIDLYRDNESDPYFSGRIYSATKRFDTSIEVMCEGLLSVLSDSIFRPITHNGSLFDLVDAIIASHNGQVENAKKIRLGTIQVSDSVCYREYKEYQPSLSRLQDLQKSYGGYFRIRKNAGLLFFDWKLQYDEPTNQAIDIHENLLDFKEEVNRSQAVTRLIPLGTEDNDGNRLTITSVNSGKDYVQAESSDISKYGYIYKTHVWEDVTEPDRLKSKAIEYLHDVLMPVRNITLTAVDLADAGYDVNHFELGQKIQLRSTPHDHDGDHNAVVAQALVGNAIVGHVAQMSWFYIRSKTLDLFNPQNNTITVGGNPIGYIQSRGMSERELQKRLEEMRNNSLKPSSLVEEAIATATALITGNSGGYIVQHDSDGDGYPDELLIMDTPSIQTATKVWRFNKNGLGYSSTGYNGTYGLAMTMNGEIVADYVTAGTMLFDRCRGGSLKLGGVNNSAGELVVYDEDNNEIGRWDKDGISITSAFQFNNGTIYTSIGKIWTFLNLIVEGTIYKQTDAFSTWYVYNGKTHTRFGQTFYGYNATEFAITRGSRYSRIITVTPNTSDIDTSTKPTSGYQVREHVNTQSTGSLVEPYTIGIHDLSNVNEQMRLTLSPSYIYMGRGFPIATSHRDYSPCVICNDDGVGMQGGTSYIDLGSTGIGMRGGDCLLQCGKGSSGRIYMKAFRVYGGVTTQYTFEVGYGVSQINGQNIQFASSSSRRYKKDIEPIKDEALDPKKILDIPIVQFRYKDDYDKLEYPDMKGKLIAGMIAEDIEKIYPSAVIHDFDGNVESWDERRLMPAMIQLLKDQQKQLDEQQKQIDELRQMVLELSKGVR